MGQLHVYFCVTSDWEENQPESALLSELDAIELDVLEKSMSYRSQAGGAPQVAELIEHRSV